MENWWITKEVLVSALFVILVLIGYNSKNFLNKK